MTEDRSVFNVTAWVDLRNRAYKLVVKNEPVDYPFFVLYNNIWNGCVSAVLISMRNVNRKDNPDRVPPELLKSENSLREHTEELEALIKKLGFKGD